MEPILTIAIPSYRRARHLRETLEKLVPQLDERSECVVLDNASPDTTPEVVASFGGKVVHLRHPENIGSDRNMIACLTAGRGRYVWILCDDDLPVSDAVETILRGIEVYGNPPYLFATQQWQDVFCSGYRTEPVRSGWLDLDADSFLKQVSFYFTAATGIVVRKDAVDIPLVESQLGSFLVPAAITLLTVDGHDRALVAEKPIAICRGGNSGGYDGLTVFTRNFLDLFRACRKTGFRPETVARVFEENLSEVGVLVARDMPIFRKGLWNLFRTSWRTRAFRKRVVPTLLRRLIRPWRLANLRDAWISKSYLRRRDKEDRAAHLGLRRVLAAVGGGGNVRHPWHVVGGRYIRIGANFWSGHDLRLEAWDRYEGTSYQPTILVGDNVSLNNGVHLGAIDRIEIGNNVIVGANVLITDHSHGNMGPEMLARPARDCPLHSRGPVLIEDDVWIGEGACILSGVRIGKSAVVGANAVVVRDVAPGEIVGGVPARRIRHLGDRS